MDWSSMKLCECGCGKEVSRKGNRFINGHNSLGNNHNLGRIHSKETREKVSKSLLGNTRTLGRKLSSLQKEKISKSLLGNTRTLGHKHSKEHIRNFQINVIKHGEIGLRTQHSKLKRQECIFGCEHAIRYDQHHEPRLTRENVKEWEGRLVNLCISCHTKVRFGSISIPKDVGVPWTIEQTNEYFGV